MRHSLSRRGPRTHHGAVGFTLVELMVTVAVLAIVLAIAVPSFRAMINRNRLVATANELSATINLNWTRMVVREATAGTVIRDVQVLGTGVVITASSNVTTNDRFGFLPTGLARIGSGTAAAGSLSACSNTLPVAENTLDVGVVASRIAVTRRNGGANCSARTD
jgi:type IV fimbrial biogenesis protein FimT